MQRKLIQQFEKIYGAGGRIQAYFAPGRVNLIGEHTDYNGGHVFPCALTLGTYGIVRKRADQKLRFFSMNFEELGIIESSLNDLVPSEAAGWTNYPKGVIWAFEREGFVLPFGLDILICGDIPNGSGLSSSASLEVLTGLILKDTFGFDISMEKTALLGQYSENHFNGCSCGIMDQFTSAMGKKNHAIFLDTNTLEYIYTPVNLADAKIIITNSKVKHSLVDSAYNDRRKESEAALLALQKVIKADTLGDLSVQEFMQHQDAIADPVQRRRARHAVCENQRTIEARQALESGDLEKFGLLMKQSHISLRDDYEVSCEEIDFLVEQAWKLPGVIGSRITGGGFGGCTVSIVKNKALTTFKEQIGRDYERQFGQHAEFYIVEIGDGAHRL